MIVPQRRRFLRSEGRRTPVGYFGDRRRISNVISVMAPMTSNSGIPSSCSISSVVHDAPAYHTLERTVDYAE